MRAVLLLALVAAAAPALAAPGASGSGAEGAGPSAVTVGDPVPLRLGPAREAGGRAAWPATSLEALALANRAARRTPALGEFLQARLIYPYEPGAVYELHTAPGYVSMILLEPGESLVDIAAGDTARWMVSSTLSGAGETSRTLVLVKPQAGGLRTNLVLVTDRRAYVVEAISAPGEAYAAQMAWRYPAAAPAPAGVEPASAPRVVNAGYRIRPPRGGAPAWMPERVFDDGARTFIAFPASIAASDMPPLFIRTGEGLELVNYRVAGRVYEVDRLFERAELRLVRAAPVVVRIERIGAGRGGRGGS